LGVRVPPSAPDILGTILKTGTWVALVQSLLGLAIKHLICISQVSLGKLWDLEGITQKASNQTMATKLSVILRSSETPTWEYWKPIAQFSKTVQTHSGTISKTAIRPSALRYLSLRSRD
jgi:hypothetical protein